MAIVRWVVMLYHANCEERRQTIPLYEALAAQDAAKGAGPQVAFVRVPSDPAEPLPRGLFDQGPSLHGTLGPGHEWFVTTPAVVELSGGKVVAVASGNAAMNLHGLIPGPKPQ